MSTRKRATRKAVARRAESLYNQLQPVPASELGSLDVDVVALQAAIEESAAQEFDLTSTVLEPPYTDFDAEIRAVTDSGAKLMFGTLATAPALKSLADDYPTSRSP